MSIQEQSVEPTNPKDGWNCLINTSKKSDGTIVEGHSYVDVVAFDDLDTDRSYAVLVCKDCNYPSVSWCEAEKSDEMIKGHAYHQVVGGPSE